MKVTLRATFTPNDRFASAPLEEADERRTPVADDEWAAASGALPMLEISVNGVLYAFVVAVEVVELIANLIQLV